MLVLERIGMLALLNVHIYACVYELLFFFCSLREGKAGSAFMKTKFLYTHDSCTIGRIRETISAVCSTCLRTVIFNMYQRTRYNVFLMTVSHV